MGSNPDSAFHLSVLSYSCHHCDRTLVEELWVERICLGWQFGGLHSIMAGTTEQTPCQWEGLSGTPYIFIDDEAEAERAGSWVMP